MWPSSHSRSPRFHASSLCRTSSTFSFASPRVSRGSSQPRAMEPVGFEPTTSALQTPRSSQLSYGPSGGPIVRARRSCEDERGKSSSNGGEPVATETKAQTEAGARARAGRDATAAIRARRGRRSPTSRSSSTTSTRRGTASGYPDDIRQIFWEPYREVTVQIPVKTGRRDDAASTTATGSSTTAPAVPTRAASASTPRSTSTRSARSPR